MGRMGLRVLIGKHILQPHDVKWQSGLQDTFFSIFIVYLGEWRLFAPWFGFCWVWFWWEFGNNSHEAFHFRNTPVSLTLQGWVIKKVPIVCNLIRNLQKILSLSFTEYNSITINFQLNLRGSLSLRRKWYETIAIVLSLTFCPHTRLLLPVISIWWD